MPIYNGFTDEFRAWTWAEQQEYIYPDSVIPWQREECDACGSTDRIGTHSEDYSLPLYAMHHNAYTLCPKCHFACHVRRLPRYYANWHRKKAEARAFRGGRTVLDDIEETLRYPSAESFEVMGIEDPYAHVRGRGEYAHPAVIPDEPPVPEPPGKPKSAQRVLPFVSQNGTPLPW